MSLTSHFPSLTGNKTWQRTAHPTAYCAVCGAVRYNMDADPPPTEVFKQTCSNLCHDTWESTPVYDLDEHFATFEPYFSKGLLIKTNEALSHICGSLLRFRFQDHDYTIYQRNKSIGTGAAEYIVGYASRDPRK